MKSCRFAKATGNKEKREQRLVLVNIALEGLKVRPADVPSTEATNRIIKKVVNYKMSPETAAERLRDIVRGL